jgi:hypothetical protein
VFGKAFLETLGQSAAKGIAALPRRVETARDAREDPENVILTAGEDVAASIFVTGDLPDEARLALLDLDLTDEHLRGKVLGWSAEKQAWLPSDAESLYRALRASRRPGGEDASCRSPGD